MGEKSCVFGRLAKAGRRVKCWVGRKVGYVEGRRVKELKDWLKKGEG